MARILVADSLAQQGIDRLAEQHEVVVRTGLSEDELVDCIPGFAGLVVRSQTQVTARVIEAGADLEVIGRAGVGVDNIDVAAASARGIIVANAPLANTISAAEHAFGLMLAVARRIPQGHASLRSGLWNRSQYMGVELAGRTLGIVGLGRIGSEVARRARAFDMQIVAYDPFVSSDRASSIGVRLVDLDELMAMSDFVTLHTALVDSTRGMINGELLSKAKPGSYIINTARGALVDEAALSEAVREGRIAGAAIDVFSEEPAVGNILTKDEDDRIVVTPHLAASTEEAQDRAALDVADQVLEVLSGGAAKFAVNVPTVDPETLAIIGPYIDAAELAGCVLMQLSRGRIQRARVEYYGEIGNYETAPLRAGFIVGMLDQVATEKVSPVNAERVLAEHGIPVEEESGPARDPYANLVTVRAVTEDGEEVVSVTHTPTGLRIVGIDDYEVEIGRDLPYLLAIHNMDRPGMVGRVGTELGELGVNISSMSVAAGAGGRALMILSTTRRLEDSELAKLTALDNIFHVDQIDLSVLSSARGR